MLTVDLIPAYDDNYIYLLTETEGGAVAVVDPGHAEPVIADLERRGSGLDVILLTHHHGDHVGGAPELKRRYGASIIGPHADAHRLPFLDTAVREGDTVTVGAETGQVVETHGHTSGHISIWFPDSRALFCGDTLFSLGCGRLFEGTAEEMWSSLGKLRALPDDAHIYCGHEYTQSNGRFALATDPDNAALKARCAHVEALRREGRSTIPVSLGEEKAANPFLRADDPGLQAALGMAGAAPAKVFAELRARKDRF